MSTLLSPPPLSPRGTRVKSTSEQAFAVLADPPVDNLQELLQRKREIEKNKTKFHLTEADCNLLLTNANEFYFQDKQVIVQQGQELLSVYRIKSGKVQIVKDGKLLSEISQGWFLGETILLNGRTCVYDASLIANGDVTICELNTPFVRKLFEVDHILALKFYRHLAAKLSSVFYALVGHFLGSPLVGLSPTPLLTRVDSTSTVSSTSSSSSSSSSTPHTSAPNAPITAITPPTLIALKFPNVPESFFLEVINRRKRQISRRKSISNMHLAFKEYQLESNGKVQGCRLKRNRMKLISEAFGFKHKTTIDYAKIKNIVRTSERSVTVIYEPLTAKTLFFKNAEDTEEFYGLATSLIETIAREIHKSTGTPISSPTLSPTERPAIAQDPQEDELKTILRNLATKVELVRGEFLMEEGDLYQRIYTILSGEVQAVKGGRVLCTMGVGEVIGVPTLLHLRPCPTNIVVTSETATIMVLPAYKINEVGLANLPLAARLYKKAATTIQSQIENNLRLMAVREAELAAMSPLPTPANT